jgi:hypothetical protein
MDRMKHCNKCERLKLSSMRGQKKKEIKIIIKKLTELLQV